MLPDEKYDWTFRIKIREAEKVFIVVFFLCLFFFFFIVLPNENYDQAFWN
jgi:hypothetical protein